MTERQIAFASARFVRDGRHFVSHRGEVVDLPADEIKRLDGLGALVPVGGELDMPGKLLPLLQNASNEHIENYVSSGKVSEILAQAEDYPVGLVDRILVVEKAGQARAALVAGLEKRIKGDESPIAPPPPVPSDPALITTEHLEQLLKKSVADVLVLATEQPLLAERLRIAEEAKPEPRKSLVEGLNKIAPPTV